MDRDRPIRLSSVNRQIRTVQRWDRQEPQDLSRIIALTLIANGDHDRMVPSNLSADLHRRIPGSTLIIHPDLGHGSVFQHREEFTRALLAHLDA